VIQAAMELLGGDVATWQRYYQGLNYDFGPMEQRGLVTYYRYAALAGLISDEVKIEVINLPVHI
jgi:chorismate dehydratase